jgi:type 1 glutamine amidotransferase
MMIQRCTIFLSMTALLLLTPSTPADTPKIVLIAGPLDRGHPAGTHEYEKTIRLIKHCLDNSPDHPAVRTELHTGGWPTDSRTLDDAATIVLISSGSDRKLSDHPLLTDDRLALIEKQMKRGCGLVLVHWSVFVPNKDAGDKMLDWVGGHFDYQSGPSPKGWYSRIQTAMIPVKPGTHPIAQGVEPFAVREEFYYRMRFNERSRPTPVLTATIPGEKEPQTVAWAIERPDGGRGFGLTGGHFFDNWKHDSYRRLLLQAVLWTAKVEFPRAGLRNAFPPEDALKRKEAPRSVVLTEGKFGKGLDATRTPVSVARREAYCEPPLTVECWAQLRSRKSYNVLVACDPKNSSHHWELYSYANTGALAAYLPGYVPSEVVSATNIADGKWHHVAFAFDGKTVRLFAEGKLVKEQGVRPGSTLKPVPGPLTIGETRTGDGTIGCDGVIDDVRISRGMRAFAAAPSEALKLDDSTLGLWQFEDGEGLTADAAWTPPPVATGPAWQRQTDVDWVDGRFRTTDTGPTFNATFQYQAVDGKTYVYRGTAIRLGDDGKAAVLFDRNQLRLAAGWTGGYLQHSDRRFALLNTPTPAGELAFTTESAPGWADPDGTHPTPTPTAPLPKSWGRFEGLHLHDRRVVLSYTVGDVSVKESPWVEKKDDLTLFTRTLEVGPSTKPLRLFVCEFPTDGPFSTFMTMGSAPTKLGANKGDMVHLVGLSGGGAKVELVPHSKKGADRQIRGADVIVPPGKETRRFKVLIGRVKNKDRNVLETLMKASPAPDDLAGLCSPGAARWGKPLETTTERGSETGPFAVDTFHVPHENPYKALMFLSGLDFLPDGTLAVCSAHGDVWLVKGVNSDDGKLTWRRFATGLYHPLGLKVVDGKVVVLERGQLTRLHDLDGDGEADRYENLCNDWHTGPGEHSYDTCLETDPAGNFYFFKTGDTNLPTGGCLIRVSKDGSKSEIFATGFRHPIGLSVSPDGIVTGADQQGNWMPATRVDVYHKNGFYGDMRAHHRTTAPTIYDPPLLWIPHDVDNSAGGQVWVEGDRFGLTPGSLIHLSYGQCRAFLVLRQQVGPVVQAGAIDLGVSFLSGSMRGRFNPRDGQLYVCGLRGWQNAARADGCLQRVRYTGKPIDLPASLEVVTGGIRLGFRSPVDRDLARDKSRYHIEQWGYRWTENYGSKDYSVRDKSREGHDTVAVDGVAVSEDGKSVLLSVAGPQPVMQMSIRYDLTAQGRPLQGMVYNTIHRIAPAHK